MKRYIIIICLAFMSLGTENDVQAQNGNPMIGEIRMFAGNFAPRGWAFCDGSLLPISQNSALFSILGTTYGGDGRTTFALPNIQSRIVVGEGLGPGLSNYRLGQVGGTETNTLNSTQLPNHTHDFTVNVNTSKGEEARATGVLSANDNSFIQQSSNGNLGGVSTSSTGQNQSVNNMQPYIVVRYIIALQGTYPSRS